MSQYYQYDTSRTARHFNFYVSSKYQCNGLWFDPTGARIYDIPRMRVWSDRGSNLRSTAHEGLIRQGLESTIYRKWGFGPTGAHFWWWVKGRQNMRTGFFTHISRQNSGGLSVFKQYFTSEQFAGWFALFHQHSSDGGYFR